MSFTSSVRTVAVSAVLACCMTYAAPASAEAPAGTAAPDKENPWEEAERVVAEINGNPVLLSDLLMEKDLGLLESGKDTGAPEGLAVPYLNRLMILEEIREFGGFTVPQSQISGAVLGYLSRFNSREEFSRRVARWGISEEEVFRRLADALTVSLYTESRIQFFIQVTPEQIEQAWRENPGKWGGKDLGDVFTLVRDDLQAESFQKEMSRWMESLRDRYRVTLIGEEGEKGP